MALSVTQTDIWTSTSRPSTHTASGLNIGAAAADRHIVVACVTDRSSGNGDVASATIGGVTATVETSVSNNTSERAGSAVFWAAVPTGTTATIVVNIPGASSYLGMVVYSVTGGVFPPEDAASDIQNGKTSTSVTLNTLSGGAIIAVSIDRQSSATPSWSGATADVTDTTNSGVYESAVASGFGADGSQLVQVTWSPGGDLATSAVSIGPAGGGVPSTPSFRPRVSII